ncbi:MAG: hypothetical protein ACKV2O_11620, partial [Acidimicrobiales bacterium]
DAIGAAAGLVSQNLRGGPSVRCRAKAQPEERGGVDRSGPTGSGWSSATGGVAFLANGARRP